MKSWRASAAWRTASSAGGVASRPEHVSTAHRPEPALQLGQLRLVLLDLGERELAPTSLALQLRLESVSSLDDLGVLCVTSRVEAIGEQRLGPCCKGFDGQDVEAAARRSHPVGDLVQRLLLDQSERDQPNGGSHVQPSQPMQPAPCRHPSRRGCCGRAVVDEHPPTPEQFGGSPLGLCRHAVTMQHLLRKPQRRSVRLKFEPKPGEVVVERECGPDAGTTHDLKAHHVDEAELA